MSKLKISILNDNIAGRWCRAEHGLSFLVEADHTILFDTSSSDLIEWNAKVMKIDLDRIETVVLSHGHDDHTGGLMHFKGRRLICHPDTFIKRYRKSNQSNMGIQWTEEEIRSVFRLSTTVHPMRLSDQIYFLGEIPRITDFESKKTAFMKADHSDDFVSDDSGLAVVTGKGLVVISGCAHSGICNMVAHARQVTGLDKIHLVIGGFHLQNNDVVTQKTIAWLKDQKVEQVVPSHCTGFPAQAAIFEHYKFIPAKSGNVIEIE